MARGQVLLLILGGIIWRLSACCGSAASDTADVTITTP